MCVGLGTGGGGGEARFYEGVEFLRAVDLDVRDVGVGVGKVEVLVGWGWGLVLCHCGWGGGVCLELCTVGGNSCAYRALHVFQVKERRIGSRFYLSLSREEVEEDLIRFGMGPRLWPDAETLPLPLK